MESFLTRSKRALPFLYELIIAFPQKWAYLCPLQSFSRCSEYINTRSSLKLSAFIWQRRKSHSGRDLLVSQAMDISWEGEAVDHLLQFTNKNWDRGK